jgi:signal transduction histidine kinase
VNPDATRDRLTLLVHEVRSLVAAIAAIAEAASQDRLDEGSVRELLRLVVAACRGIERVVGEAALGSVRLEDVDVGQLVADAVASAALGGTRIRAVIAPDLGRIGADPIRLRQALDNLIVNAATHAGSDAEVVVHAGAEHDSVRLSVSDRGRGIALEDQSRIFEFGVRLDTGRPGSGLGLSVVRAIAEAHGGTLSVESTPGRGATFTIALPVGRR